MLNKKIYINILTLYFFLLPSLGNALCLQNCRQEASRIGTSRNSSYLDQMTSSMPPPVRNIKTDDVKNTVFGDMNIRVGHEKVDIRTESNSSNNAINASINSTIILGDMTK